MMASTLAFRLILSSCVAATRLDSLYTRLPRARLHPITRKAARAGDPAIRPGLTSTSPLRGSGQLQPNVSDYLLPPIILYRRAFRHQRVEVDVLLEHDLSENLVLTSQHRLQANQLQDGQERAHQRRARPHVAQQLLQADGAVFQRKSPPDVINHLRNGHTVVFNVEAWF